VPLTNPEADFGVQLIGVASIGAFIFIVSLVIWTILKMVGVRASLEEESMGLDQAEIGVVAYPEFHVSGQRI
jgi:Amt family ammonium transporter